MIERVRKLSARAMWNPWFAYGSIVLLQLKVIWGVWLLRDLTGGDTSSYFVTAFDWYRNWLLLMTWSPLYTSFYGAMLYFSKDAYAATIAHRLITVLALSAMVLALMRRLLPPAIAWFMAAWWVVLPIDFDTLYEVHLFAVIPVVAAFLAILAKPGPLGRGCGVAILLAATLLMRNELLLATLLFAALSIGWDMLRKTPGLFRAYGIPVACAGLVVFSIYWRSTDKPFIRGLLSRKHTLNTCQTYAFGYQQRSPDWNGSPWLECQQLMTRVYGAPEPSLVEAFSRNPSAMLEHFWWNLQLVPNGIQILLFNSMSGSVTPDYPPVPIRPLPALAASLLALTITAAGVSILWRDRDHWWKLWLRDRAWAWMAMACVAVVVMIVMITQRPRPSYMFTLGLMLRAVIGTSLFAIMSRLPRLSRLEPAMPAAIVIAILLAPRYYYVTNPSGVRPLADIYWRLAPFQRRLEKPGTGLAAIGASELCNYLARSSSCLPLDTNELRREITAETPWDKTLAKHGATLFYADEELMADSMVRQFVSGGESHGWHTLALHSEPEQNWAVLEPSGAPAPAAVPGEIIAPDSGITLGQGWYDLETSAGAQFRWVNNDAQLAVWRQDPGPLSLLLEVEEGFSLGGKPLSLQVFRDDRRLQTVIAAGHQTVAIKLPSGHVTIRLHVESVNRPVPHDPRILNFRVFRVSAQ
jgi:hypothetical protein